MRIREKVLTHLKSGANGNTPKADADHKALRERLKVSQEAEELFLCVWGPLTLQVGRIQLPSVQSQRLCPKEMAYVLRVSVQRHSR